MLEQPKLRLPNQLRLVDDVYQSLESAILSGQLPPGERLIEARIAEELGVSRTTVREALLKLGRQRLVTTNPRRGTFVTRLSQADAYDLGYARALLEGFALTVGYAHVDSQTFADLEACLACMARCRIPQDVPELVQIDLAFHRILVERSGSVRLIELWASLNGQIGALFIRGIERQHADVEAVVAMHRDLLEAVRSPDPTVLQQAVLDHYVGSSTGAAEVAPLVHQAIQTLAPSYLAVHPNAADENTHS